MIELHRLGKGDTEEVGLGQLGPQPPVHALGPGLQLLEPFPGHLLAHDLVGQALDVRLHLVQGEVHGRY